MPSPVASNKPKPPPLPAKPLAPSPALDAPKAPEPAQRTAGRQTPIKLNPSATETGSTKESLFSEVPEVNATPKEWKELHPGELHLPSEGLQSLEAFSRSQQTPPKLTSPESPATLPPAVVLSAPAAPVQPKDPVRPPPLPVKNPASPTIHVAPRLLESESIGHADKLLPPAQRPTDHRTEEKPTLPVSKQADTAEKTVLHKAPHLISTEPPVVATPPPVVSAKAPPSAPVSKSTGPILLRDMPVTGIAAPATKPSQTAAPPKIEVKSTPPLTGHMPAKAADAKPSLKPAILPNKTLAASKSIEAPPPKSPAESGTHPPRVALPINRAPLPLTRTERAKKRRLVGTVVFYGVMLGVGLALYFGSLFFSRETRVEGQVIPPSGMPLDNEVWIVSDFRDSTSNLAEDLTEEHAPLLLEMQEQENHVQHAQADIALREERIHLLNGQIQADKDELADIGKQAREATQKIWDGPGAQLDAEYDQKLNNLQNAISDRAKSLKLDYQPDNTYHSPEVWANAYRLALYGVGNGVDSAKELLWLGDQMKQWRDYLKTLDDRKEQLREQAAQIKVAPASKITDLTAKLEELQNRVDATETEEDPIKSELVQAQTDLAQAQASDAGLDEKYYTQLYAIPGENISNNKRIPLLPNGRFSWVEEESTFAAGEKEHHYWIFARATRSDGRQYWALGQFTIEKDHKVNLLIGPESFISTKAILCPNLSPEEQAQ